MNRVLSFIVLIFLMGCNESTSTSEEEISNNDQFPPLSNIEMAKELKLIADNCDPRIAWHLNKQLAEIYRLELKQSTGNARIPLRFKYAEQLLKAGKTMLAIEEFLLVKKEFEKRGIGLTDQSKLVYDMLAVAYFRQAEQENCNAEHNEESCIIPMQEHAIHNRREGSESAIEVYKIILAKYPNDLQSRYLLNLAYMTLGEYPDGVPDEYLMKNFASFTKNPLLPRFREVAIQSGTDVFGLSGGTCVEDFNNDGLLDIMASSYGLSDQLKYFLNMGDGTFEDYTDRAGLKGIVSGLNTLQADYNNDGFVDVLVLRGAWLGKAGLHPNSLLRNNGNNTFTDVTRSSEIYSLNPTQTAVWRDMDLDGWVDLFIGNESGKSQKKRCEYFHNNGDGTFSEKALEIGINIESYVKGVSSGDVNNDGWPDLYISVITGPNYLFLNQGVDDKGVVHFTDISASSGTQYPMFSFPCWFWDYNQDGWDDIFAVSYDLSGFEDMAGQIAAEMMGSPTTAELPKAYKNNGNLTFSDVTAELGLDNLMYAMGSNYGDLNNDGFDDFYIGNGAPDFRMIIPNKMFLNNKGVHFNEVTYDGGFAHIQKGHAVSFGDIDNDGDQDIYCVMGGAVEGDKYNNLLFENPGNDNNWITLRLEGTTSNRKAIGARVRIHGRNKEGQSIVRYHTVCTGGSFGGSSLQVEAGLSHMQRLDSVVVQWPYRAHEMETFTGMQMKGIYRLVENSGLIRIENSPSFNFGPVMD
jgi:FG-GAP-like repeat/ASPIC and UnbV